MSIDDPSTGSATIEKWLCRSPRCPALGDGVGIGEQFPGAGGQRLFVRLPDGDQTLVEFAWHHVPAEAGRQGCCVEGTPHAGASTIDAAQALVRARVVIERSEACQAGGLLA